MAIKEFLKKVGEMKASPSRGRAAYRRRRIAEMKEEKAAPAPAPVKQTIMTAGPAATKKPVRRYRRGIMNY